MFPDALNDWSVILEHLKSLNYRGAIIGPPGSGKTTLLRDLKPTLAIATRAQVQRVCVDARGTIPPLDISDDAVVLLDDADRIGFLSSWRYKRLLKGCQRLIITSRVEGKLPNFRALSDKRRSAFSRDFTHLRASAVPGDRGGAGKAQGEREGRDEGSWGKLRRAHDGEAGLKSQVPPTR